MIGIDIGTTSTKVIVCSPDLQIRGQANVGYPLTVPQPGWAEQDPSQILTAMVQAVREAIAQAQISPSQITGLSFSSAMHTLIAMDAEDQPLTPCLIWADNRSQPQAQRLQAQAGLDLYHRTGTPIHPMSPLTKLIWLREQRPQLFQRMAKAISIKEFILHRLFDRYVVDHATASATGLFNLHQLTWDDQALAWAGISIDHLSELVPATRILTGMTSKGAEWLGLDPQTPVVIGASDGVLANLGVGAVGEQWAITIGTSGAVRQLGSQPVTDPQGRTFCYALTPELWGIGGASNGGRVLQWFRDQLAHGDVEQARCEGRDPFEVMIQQAATVPAGSEGLICLPFWAGERAPYWNPQARGVFYGLGLHHQRAHLIRAVLEGILYSLYTISLALQPLGGSPQQLRASGGFAQSPTWCQMLADLFGVPVEVPQITEASAWGACLLGQQALGIGSRNVTDDAIIQIKSQHYPELRNTATYRHHVEIYQQLYGKLAPLFNTSETSEGSESDHDLREQS